MKCAHTDIPDEEAPIDGDAPAAATGVPGPSW